MRKGREGDGEGEREVGNEKGERGRWERREGGREGERGERKIGKEKGR